MIPQKKPMEIIRENGIYRCVKLNRKYYCIAYDEATNTTRAIITHDRVVGELRTYEGYSHAAVEYVAKGRKRDTAIAYFNAFLRGLKSQTRHAPTVVFKEAGLKTMPLAAEETQPICSWCNGSGVDPRNVEWRCARC